MTDFTDHLNDTFADVSDVRFDQVENNPELEGLDPFLGGSDLKRAAAAADHWKQVNNARRSLDCVTSDGLIIEATYSAASQTEPTLIREGYLLVAAEALRAIAALDALVASEFKAIEVEKKDRKK